MLFTILSFFVLQFLSAQGDFDLFIEDVDNPTYNEEYITEPDFYLDNNNGMVLNFSIIKPLPEGVQGRFEMMRASMGEYVVNIGVNVTMDLCDSIEEPILIGPMFQTMGFTSDNCPPDVGVYQLEGYKLLKDSLPENIPSNKYKVTLDIFHGEQVIMTFVALVRTI